MRVRVDRNGSGGGGGEVYAGAGTGTGATEGTVREDRVYGMHALACDAKPFRPSGTDYDALDCISFTVLSHALAVF